MINYRDITLLSVGVKVYNRILLNRRRQALKKILRNNEAGFRPGRGTTELTACLRRIIEEAIAKNLPLIIIFFDFRKAFDSVNREMLFEILRHYGNLETVVKAIARLHYGSETGIMVNGKLSDEFHINTGLLQGNVLAPYLFIIEVDYVMNKASGDYGFEFFRRKSSMMSYKICELDYAYDIALLEKQYIAVVLLDRVQKEALRIKLEINVAKTEFMCYNLPEDTSVLLE